jgi:hypothetical protein
MTKEKENLTAKMEPVIEWHETSFDKDDFGQRADEGIIKDINAVLGVVGIPEKITGIKYTTELSSKIFLSFVLPEQSYTGSNSYLGDFLDQNTELAYYIYNPNTFNEIPEQEYFKAVIGIMGILNKHDNFTGGSVAAFKSLFVLDTAQAKKVLPMALNCVKAWEGIMALYELLRTTDSETFNQVVPEAFEIEGIALHK